MVKKIGTSLLMFAFLLTANIQFGQSLNLSVDTSSFIVGQQRSLTLEYVHKLESGKLDFKWPSFQDTITEFIEVVNIGKLDTTSGQQNEFIVSQTILITSFDSGHHVIPPIRLFNNEQLIESNPLLLSVIGIQTDPNASTIVDVEKIYVKNEGWKDRIKTSIPIILVAILIAALIILITRKRKKEVKPSDTKVAAEVKEVIPAHIWAKEKLKELKAKELWQRGLAKEYQDQVSLITREYLQRRYGINTLDATTDEILTRIKPSLSNEELFSNVKHLLELADFAKFAKYQPGAKDHENSFSIAERLIEKTQVKTSDQ